MLILEKKNNPKEITHFQLKELEKKHCKPKISGKKGINTRRKINEIENTKQQSPKFSSLKAFTELTNL